MLNALASSTSTLTPELRFASWLAELTWGTDFSQQAQPIGNPSGQLVGPSDRRK